MNYLKTYLLDVISKHYFDFKGREGRKVFWLFTLNMFIINFILGLISAGFLSIIISIAIFFPSLGLSVRRLHDINFSGWWVLIGFIPLIGVIALIVFACIPVGFNRQKYDFILILRSWLLIIFALSKRLWKKSRFEPPTTISPTSS